MQFDTASWRLFLNLLLTERVKPAPLEPTASPEMRKPTTRLRGGPQVLTAQE